MTLVVVGFDWDRGNRDKCQKHGVSTAVIESLFRSPIAVFRDPEHSARQERFKAIGRTEDGRGLLIVFTLREHDGETLPISARYMQGDRVLMRQKLPKLQSDAEAEEFVTNADLTDYDLSEFWTVLFEFQPKM
jgi:uncharacterized protein